MEKVLVAYFSASGVTKNVAENLSKQMNADLFEIEPEIKYTKEDLDWTNDKSRSSVEMKDKAFRPKMKAKNLDILQYDKIVLGFPIWWYVAPTIINTFLESYDFSDKNIILFATSGSSGFGDTVKELKISAKNANIKEGKILNHITDSMIKSFIDSL